MSENMSIAICFSQKQLKPFSKTCYQLKTCISWIFTKTISKERLLAEISAKSWLSQQIAFVIIES